MISRSTFHIPHPSGGRGRRIRAVKCPVCSIFLTADDFRPDPVLQRRVRRAQELEAREAEEEEEQEESGPRGGRPDRVTLASDAVDGDDGMDVDTDAESDQASEPIHVKTERGVTTFESSGEDGEETGEDLETGSDNSDDH